MATLDLLVRNGYLPDSDRVVDIGIADGTIVEIKPEIESDAPNEIDAEGNLVSPGFVDCHKHIDRAFVACGDRVPKHNESSFTHETIAELFREHTGEMSVEEIEENAIRDIQMAVANGTTHLRSHVSVDYTTFGTRNLDACLRARDRVSELIDVELVPGVRTTLEGQSIVNDRAQEAMRTALEMGGDEILVGGSDPASRDDQIERPLEVWFDIATEYDRDIDLHIQDPGTLGHHTLERLAEKTVEYEYGGRVTASHGYALAQVPDWWIDELIDTLERSGVSLVTCYQSTEPKMPIREIIDGGVNLGHGTDNDRDYVFPHGNADPVQAALILSNKLHGEKGFAEEYRWFDTNDGLALLWDLITKQGAAVTGLDEYGITVGAPADIVVFDEPSPQWAIITQATKSYVIKAGNVVARDGEVRPEYRVV